MTKETLRKAKTLEEDIKIIEKVLAESRERRWIKIITPKHTEHYHSVRFQHELTKWLEDKKQEYEQELEIL